MTSKEQRKNIQNHLTGFSIGAIASCGAVTFTNPWEVVKIRLQLQGEHILTSSSVKLPYTNALSAFTYIAKTESIRGLQKGLGPAYIYQVFMNGTRLGLYEPLRNVIHQGVTLVSSLIFKKEVSVHPVYAMVVSGALSGCAGSIIASPIFLVKTRMQSFSLVTPSVGFQHASSQEGLLGSLKHIYGKEGLKGLWRGVDAAMMRTGVGSAVQLSTYDQTKQALLSTVYFKKRGNEDWITFDVKCLAMNPFDVASTRMYNQKIGSNGKGLLYTNGIDCIQKTVKGEGIRALYKGFSAHYLRIGPHTILTFVFLEQARSFAKQHGWMD